MTRVFLLFLLVLSLVSSSGCAWFKGRLGSPPDSQNASAIVPGQTTRAEVEKMFGAPDAVARLAAGDAYLYRYDEAKFVGWTVFLFTWGSLDVKPDRLLVAFDPNGVVTHVAYRHEAPNAEFDVWP